MMRIVNIAHYRKKFTKGDNMSEKNIRFSDIVDDISNNYKGKVISINDAIDAANMILGKAKEIGYVENGETPIVSIVKHFGIDVYGTKKFKDVYKGENISGVIYVNGTTEEIYNNNKVIFINSEEPFQHQRFIMAHELGHYLFDFLCNEEYDDENILFTETYVKGEYNHGVQKEKIADRFAAELLMPTDAFVKQYRHASHDRQVPDNFKRYFTIEYLSGFFNVKQSSVEKRIGEVLYNE